MDRDIDRLLRITDDMADAFEREDLDGCARLLEERGRLLLILSDNYGPRSGREAPAELAAVMSRIRALDRTLEERLTAELNNTGRRLGDIRQKTRRKVDGSPAVCLNRRV